MKNKKAASRNLYFDCNATTPVFPFALDASTQTMALIYGNPSSLHQTGLHAKELLNSARTSVAEIVGADSPSQIIFNSGATEGIHTSVFSALQFAKKNTELKNRKKVVYGETEHKAVSEALQHWITALDLSYEIVALEVDSKGQYDLKQLKELLPDTALLCTMAVNNETGVIQDIRSIEKLLNETKSITPWLVDCVQALGKIDLELSKTRIDYATFSGHKLYAPKGIGFLYVGKSSPYTPLLVGGGQEMGLRSGTENLPGIAALQAVIEKMNGPLFHSKKKLYEFRSAIAKEISNAFPEVQFNTPLDESSVPTTLNFSIPGFKGSELLGLFDTAGLRISAGSACSSSSVKPSHVLSAMKFPDWRASSAVRLSFGPCTTELEIEGCLEAIRECSRALQTPSPLKDGVTQLRDGFNNTWMITHKESKKCIIIDPCANLVKKIESFVSVNSLQVLAVLDTHSHADHESIRPTLEKKFNLMNTDSLGWPLKGGANDTIKTKLVTGESVDAIVIWSNGDTHELVLSKISTPGHTSDSCTYLYGAAKHGTLLADSIQFAFVGDAVLAGGLGRSNFSTSDTRALYESIKKLNKIVNPDTTVLCSAHDYQNSFVTTLTTEANSNELFSLVTDSSIGNAMNTFLAKKTEIDLELTQLEKHCQETICGVTPTGAATNCQSLSIDLQHLKTLKNFIAVDVRDHAEASFQMDWGKVGLASAPLHTPLSQLGDFAQELKTNPKLKNHDVIFICRSGNKSLQAAKSLNRMGLQTVKSLDGGLAKVLR